MPFRIDAPQLARAVVDVEIGLERIIVRTRRDRIRRPPFHVILKAVLADLEGPMGDVAVDIVERAEQALLLPFPQCETDGPLRPDAELAEDARGFHDDDAARAVVGGAITGVPAI